MSSGLLYAGTHALVAQKSANTFARAVKWCHSKLEVTRFHILKLALLNHD
jgi:hypothetical protein